MRLESEEGKDATVRTMVMFCIMCALVSAYMARRLMEVVREKRFRRLDTSEEAWGQPRQDLAGQVGRQFRFCSLPWTPFVNMRIVSDLSANYLR